MSTRSGKRLHNSPNENIEPEVTSKRLKKTRNKRVVENGDEQKVLLKPKKRQNYVRFPSEEDTTGVNPPGDEAPVKPVRALRRHTLKEQNAVPEEVETTKKQIRSTRHSIKFPETSSNEVTGIPQNENQVELVTTTKGKQKGKKNNKKSKKIEQPEMNKENDGELVKKKKTKKKNSKSNSFIIVTEETGGKRESNISTDSFHSAAGSPACIDIISPLNKNSPKHESETGTIQNVSENRKKRSSLKETSDVSTTKMSMEVDEDVTINTDKVTNIVESKRRSSLKIVMPDKDSQLLDIADKVNLNATFEKEPTEGSNKKKKKANVVVENTSDIPATKNTFSNLDVPKSMTILNTTFEKDDIDDVESKKTPKILVNNEQVDMFPNKFLNLSEKRISLNVSEKASLLNSTFDMSPKPDPTKPKLDSTFDKGSKLDLTFDKTDPKRNSTSKSSLISSDNTNSSMVTLDKSDEYSKISITDDDSKTENILNTAPLLIESSMEESKLESSKITPEPNPTPLKREGTFTKDSPAVSMSPKQTPSKRQSLPAAGCTPYHSNRKVAQRSVLNLTHSIEKPARRSSPAEPPRATKVVFCSPVNNPGLNTQRKTNIIKSNLKGSNKSFVFDESMSSLVPGRLGRKRSFTHAEGAAPAPAAAAGGAAKRARRDGPAPAERRQRTESQPTKPSNTTTPSKTPSKLTPSKPRSDVKATKLPNFAALHARRFERMESLDECQQRKAKRARQLLVPTGSVAVLERSSPRVTLEAKAKDTPPKAATPAKSASKLPTLATLQRGYTRFGFKMHCDVNPFSVPPKLAEKKPKETRPNRQPNSIKPVVAKRQVIQPSLAGATSLRREAAKQTIMREKSFTLAEKRNEIRKEVRTVIKGVRTNRRFELQMLSRNIHG